MDEMSSCALQKHIHDTKLLEHQVALWSLGNAGLVIKSPDTGEWLVIDPYLTNAIETNKPGTEFVRTFSPPMSPDGLAGAAAVLVTHHHDDHLDFSTLGPLQNVSPETKFFVPAAQLEFCVQNGLDRERLQGLREGHQIQTAGMTITPVDAAHEAYECDSEGNSLYLGYLIEAAGYRIYVSGDTVCTDKLLEQVSDFRPDIVCLPINGRDYFRTKRDIAGNMTYREAVDFAAQVDARLIVPYHYDLFHNNRDNPSYFVDYLMVSQPKLAFRMLRPGEGMVYAEPRRNRDV